MRITQLSYSHAFTPTLSRPSGRRLGLGGNGDVCGAVVGALAAMGLRFSRASEDEKEDLKMWSYAHEVLERFQKKIAKNHGSILCREIARVNWKDRELS